MNFDDFLHFRKMITPVIIQAVFWIASGAAVIFGFIGVISGLSSSYGGGAQVFIGLLTMAIGPLVARIYCELLILFFRMNETLTDIRNLVGKPDAAAHATAGDPAR